MTAMIKYPLIGEPGGSGDTDLVIDIDNGGSAGDQADKEDPSGVSGGKHPKKALTRVWSGFKSVGKSVKGQEAGASAGGYLRSSVLVPIADPDALRHAKSGGGDNLNPLEKKVETGKSKKKSGYKHAKPPRPPKAPSLDAADQKLVREISELAALKRARTERMKALRAMKNAKAGSSNSNFWALVITVLFCLIIIWHGFFSGRDSNVNFEGSPVSSLRSRRGFISVQYYKPSTQSNSNDFSSASPNIIERVSG